MTARLAVVDMLDEEGRQAFLFAGLSLGVLAAGSASAVASPSSGACHSFVTPRVG